MSKSHDYYTVLRVGPSATGEEIKRAFRRLARQCHPDLHPNDPTAQERFQLIVEAYEILSDPGQRRRYDRNFDGRRAETSTTKPHAQDLYARGNKKAQQRDYSGAIQDYSELIQHNPRFIEVYLKRAEAYYSLGDDKSVLEDCNQIFKLDPEQAQAYLLRGRARYRLGYTQSAIEAYTQAIRLNPSYAQAYYQRGLAHGELRNFPKIVDDLQTAARLFKQQGDWSHCRLVEAHLNRLGQPRFRIPSSSLEQIFIGTQFWLGLLFRAGQNLFLNPTGSLLPTFSSLNQVQAASVGLVFALLGDLCFVVGAYFGLGIRTELTWLRLMFVGAVPFVCLVVVGAIAQWLAHRRQGLSGGIFVAGSVMLPIGFFVLVSSLGLQLSLPIVVVAIVFLSCYAILILYTGCTQIANLAEPTAALTVPIMLLTGSWLTYWTFLAVFS